MYDSIMDVCISVVWRDKHELLSMDLSDVWCKCPGACPHASAGCKSVDACLL